MSRKIELGDWQTPPSLAAACVARLRSAYTPRAVLEPTCGVGAFLRVAREAWPEARLVGRELRPDYAAEARAVPGAQVQVADFFHTDWRALCATLPAPLLVLGNPPWVTSAALGALGSGNRPRQRPAELRGLDAVTGRSNFDVSEFIVSELLDALRGRDFVLAMLLKVAVARRLVERHGLGGEIRRIDATRAFDASVDAAFVVLRPGDATWPVYDRFDDETPSRRWGLVDGALTPDLRAYERTAHLAGTCAPTWRSGLKHDCAAVMELRSEGDRLRSRAQAVVELEPDLRYPLAKGSDLAKGRAPSREVLVPQRRLGEATAWIEHALPNTWAYLERHRGRLDARKSRIYRGQPPFCVFGVGDYTFAPYKVAVAGLYPDLRFQLLEPLEGRAILLDDTGYFLPFETRAPAVVALGALRSDEARAFFEARMFRGVKRPVTKRLLSALDWTRIPVARRNQAPAATSD